jgi:hypothetical protein
MKQHSKILIASLVLFLISIVAMVVATAVSASRSGDDTYEDKKTEDKCIGIHKSTKEGTPCGAWKDGTCFKGTIQGNICEYPGDSVVAIPIGFGGVCLLTSIILLIVGLVLSSKGK